MLKPTRTRGPLRWSLTLCALTRTPERQRENLGAGGATGEGGQGTQPRAHGWAESPVAQSVLGGGGGGAPNPALTRFLLAGAQVWHAQAEEALGRMWAVASGLRVALLQAKMEVEVGPVVPDMGWLEQAHVWLV